MNDLKPVLKDAGFTVEPASYGQFSVQRFLWPEPLWPEPLRPLRAKAVKQVVADIRTARRLYNMDKGHDPKRMSVIAHSFGTYIVGRLLQDYSEFQWYRIIFCGSVVEETFPFDQVLERFSRPLLNEIGTNDYWPALAESAGWGFGSVGSTGFNRPGVVSRWHHGYTHSDFLTEDFCKEFWIPFLQGHEPKPAGKSTQLPLYVRLICMVPLRWVTGFLFLPILYIAWLYYFVFRLAVSFFR